MPKAAAIQYLQARDLLHRAFNAIDSINADPDLQNVLRRAAGNWAKKKLRGISTALTARLGNRFQAACEFRERGPVQHALPLNLLHNHILGLDRNNARTGTWNRAWTHASLETFLKKFVVGVGVVEEQHRKLDRLFKEKMPTAFDFDDPLFDDWSWEDVAQSGWSWEERPLQVRRLMARYDHEDVDIRYHPAGSCARCAR